LKAGKREACETGVIDDGDGCGASGHKVEVKVVEGSRVSLSSIAGNVDVVHRGGIDDDVLKQGVGVDLEGVGDGER